MHDFSIFQPTLMSSIFLRKGRR